MYKRAYFMLILITWATHPSIELNITPHYSLQKGIDLNVVTHLGAGFFCEFNKVLQSIIYFEDQGLYTVEVNWADPFFPYKTILPRMAGIYTLSQSKQLIFLKKMSQ